VSSELTYILSGGKRREGFVVGGGQEEEISSTHSIILYPLGTPPEER